MYGRTIIFTLLAPSLWSVIEAAVTSLNANGVIRHLFKSSDNSGFIVEVFSNQDGAGKSLEVCSKFKRAGYGKSNCNRGRNLINLLTMLLVIS
jgi:hypothetical protein